MAVHRLEEPEWAGYFDRMSRALIGKRAEIEVASLDLGVHVQAAWVLLLGIVYDVRDDALEIALDGLDHLISRPREIYVDEGLGGLVSLEVVDDAGIRDIIQLREPAMFLAPSPSE